MAKEPYEPPTVKDAVTVWIDCDERYPHFSLLDHKQQSMPEIVLTAEEYADYQRVSREFYAWQDKLDKAGWGPKGVDG